MVHTHGYRSDLLDAGVARSIGLPVVSTVHGSSRLGGKTHFYEWVQLRAWRRFDAVIAVSRPLEGMLRKAGVSQDRVHVVPNAWPGTLPSLARAEARRRLGISDGVFAIGFVGRLIRAKGPDVLLRALPLLGDIPWHAVFIGDGGERSTLERLVGELGLEGRVTLAGHLDDATDLFRAFDAFVLSSRTEGTPIALFEAMAAEVPIVAFAVGGVPDVVSDREAFLAEPETPAAHWPMRSGQSTVRLRWLWSARRRLDRVSSGSSVPRPGSHATMRSTGKSWRARSERLGGLDGRIGSHG